MKANTVGEVPLVLVIARWCQVESQTLEKAGAELMIRRIRLSELSATKMRPRESTATPRGEENVALDAAPSLGFPFALAPVPASVVTRPSGVTLRTRCVPVSTTIMLPCRSTTTP